MQTRYMERTNSMARGKRSLEGGGDDDDDQPNRKKPALARVIVEALKFDHLQKLFSSLEPVLRRVIILYGKFHDVEPVGSFIKVSEEVERALAKLAPAALNGRSPPRQIEGPGGRKLQLKFRSRLSLPLFTGGKVEGEQGAAIHIVLFDADTGHVVTSGPEASAKLDVVVLEGDFNNEDDEEWTQDEFENHVVKEREGKRPLLMGELQVTLKEGVGTLGDLTFTDNSSWIRSRKFRLGLRIDTGFCEGIRIREAKTEAFIVKDHRGELYKKHYPPSLNDDVWRLEKIGKDGSFHKKLNKNGIFTVEDFLRLAVKDSQKLRNILGSCMPNKIWEALLEHAKTCVLSGKLYVYHPEDSRNVGVVFNDIYELNGLISEEQYLPADTLSDEQKVYVDTLVKKAYDNWSRVVEYDGRSLLSFKQSKKSSASINEVQLGQISYPNALDHQIQEPRLPSTVPNEQPSLQVGGYNDNSVARYSNQSQSQLGYPNSRSQYDITSFAQQEHLISHSHQTPGMRNDNNVAGMALGPLQPSTSVFQTTGSSMQSSNLNPFDDWTHPGGKGVNEYFTEEEIRLRSHEMLENEDMQHLLRFYSMGGHDSGHMPEDGFGFPGYMASPMPSLDEDRTRPGKAAVVGWLKIKAAMRWGFFVRKKAAERRAQLVELDEDE